MDKPDDVGMDFLHDDTVALHLPNEGLQYHHRKGTTTSELGSFLSESFLSIISKVWK